MKRDILTGALLAVFLCFQAGCGLTHQKALDTQAADAKTTASDQPAAAAEHGSEQMHRRFEAGRQEGADAVQSVLVWSQRYEELSLKNNLLREKNSEIRAENSELKQRADTLEMELEKTKQELAEANDFLQQMHVELNEWKGNVLGFRDEMRQAQKVQLEALAKILRVLGAEPVAVPEGENEDSSNSKEAQS